MMTFGSLFSGAGGFDIGFHRAGLKCRWQVEIDRQAAAVLRKHYRRVPKFSDVRDVGGHNLKPVDCIIGGSPCQGFSVAGQRVGVEDERSGLFTEMVRVVDELKPKYVVWENVPGVVSGFDEVLADEHYELFSWAERRALEVEAGGLIRRWWLGAVLRSFADIGYGGAYRILDARWFGVPQRRRRIFAVFVRQSRGDSGAGRAAKILALTEGLRGHLAKGRQAGEDVAGTLAPCLRSSGVGTERIGDTRGQDCVVPTLARALTTSNQRIDSETETLIAHTLRAEGFDASEDGTGRGTPLVPFMANDYASGGYEDCKTARPLTTSADRSRAAPVVAFAQNTRDEVREIGNGLVGALPAQPGMKQQSYIAYAIQERAVSESLTSGPGGMGIKANEAYTLEARHHVQAVACHGVRRLTPRECERLMSWPDDWTATGIDEKGNTITMADGPRYRMCGNGVVSNVAEWIGRRLMTTPSPTHPAAPHEPPGDPQCTR